MNMKMMMMLMMMYDYDDDDDDVCRYASVAFEVQCVYSHCSDEALSTSDCRASEHVSSPGGNDRRSSG